MSLVTILLIILIILAFGGGGRGTGRHGFATTAGEEAGRRLDDAGLRAVATGVGGGQGLAHVSHDNSRLFPMVLTSLPLQR